MAVFGWFVHYVLIMVILAAVAVAGVFAGRKWAEKSKAKKALQLRKCRKR